MTTNNFMFNVSPKYFPGHILTKPFYLKVMYAYSEKSFLDVWNVEMSFNAIGTLSLSSNLKDEIRTAALDHYQKHK
jgi:hypothetical protein